MIVVLAELSRCRLMPFFIVAVTYFVTARPSRYLVVFCVCFCNPHPIYTHLLSCGVSVLPWPTSGLHPIVVLLFLCVFRPLRKSVCRKHPSCTWTCFRCVPYSLFFHLGVVFYCQSPVLLLKLVSSFQVVSDSHEKNIIFHSEQLLAFLTCLETLTLRLFLIL